jgi:hypothetical protein
MNDSEREIYEEYKKIVSASHTTTTLTYFVHNTDRTNNFYKGIENKIEYLRSVSGGAPLLVEDIHAKHIENLKKGLVDCIQHSKGKEKKVLEMYLISIEGDYKNDQDIQAALNLNFQDYQRIKSDALNQIADHPVYDELTWFYEMFSPKQA